MVSNHNEYKSWHFKVQNISKPVIYALLMAVVIFPLFKPLQLPLAYSRHTQKAHDIIDSLPEGSYVFHSVAILPAADAELWPQMISLSRHYMEKGLKVLYWSCSQEGHMYAGRILEDIAPLYDYEYGEDLLILPYKAGQESAVLGLKDFYSTFQTDVYGTPVDDIPMLSDFSGLQDLSLCVVNTGSDDISYFVRHIGPAFDMPIIAAGTAPVLPYVAPYLDSGQVKGAIIGTSGAAEYEMLAGLPGMATGAMDAQQVGHVFIITMIVLGNIGYIFERKSQRRRGGSHG